MRYTPDNFLYGIKQLVTGKNGDDTPDIGTLPGTSGGPGSAQSADGGIRKDELISLTDLIAPNAFPAITDSTGGTASTTFAAITAGASYAQADMVAVKNALAEIAKVLNALNGSFAGNDGAATPTTALVTASGSSPTVATVSFPIPRDYDEASDQLTLRLLMKLANADASITVTGTATVLPIATGTASPKTAVTGKAPFQTSNLNLSQTEQVLDINLSSYGLKRDDVISIVVALSGTTTGNTYLYGVERTYASTIVSYNETDATQSPNGTTANVLPGFGNPLR